MVVLNLVTRALVPCKGDLSKLFWFEYQQNEFIKLKHRLYSAPVLTLQDLEQPFEIEIDACDYAIGVVLT